MSNNTFCELNFTQNFDSENEDRQMDSGSYTSDALPPENTDITDFEKHVICHKNNLQQRLRDLHETMMFLKTRLAEEKFLLEESRKESRIYETRTTPTVGFENSVQHQVSEILEKPAMSASEYQEKLTKYESALLKAQADKRASLKRQISINNYKRQLLEVENLCNLELLRVKQSVQVLQPLQMIASEWKRTSNDGAGNDVEITGIQGKKSNKEYFSEPSTSEERLVLEFADVPVNDGHLLQKHESCDIGKTAKISSSSQVWGEDDDLNSICTNAWYSTDRYLRSSGFSDNERSTII
ncbi:hypothetical protein PPYR_15207 [Photinus pyralis]|uniref:Uncharacterized protein n=2 Tax=Photinus pyralis TaxID=7054 RepID=A0A5N3ZZD2_PHOPY|nr:uncharacterized protein LOC116182123 [Photinus pyralis]KAB0790423.1 hypothetical protein PPYR_15207 [Photinus pyralis]